MRLWWVLKKRKYSHRKTFCFNIFNIQELKDRNINTHAEADIFIFIINCNDFVSKFESI